jgi:plasmid stabilization system protein ParE
MVQIKITAKAKKDIAGIYNYILADSPQNAAQVAEAIIRKIDVLKKQPDFGKIVKEFDNPLIRELKLFKYRIIYRISSAKSVEIITVHHSARLINNNPHLKDFFE